MLKNYIKIALAVLRRRKFFTFISLFGISFTLTILMVLAAFLEQITGNTYPDRKRDRSLYVSSLQEIDKGKDYTAARGGAPSFYFLSRYISGLKRPAAMALISRPLRTNIYLNKKPEQIVFKYTNSVFWDILEFDFLEGRPYSGVQVAGGEPVAVISEDAKKTYFGDTPSVTGRYIEFGGARYRISGVVRSVPAINMTCFSDIYLPYTLNRTEIGQKTYFGNYAAILLASSRGEVPAMQEEYDRLIPRIPLEDGHKGKLYCHADPYFASLVRRGEDDVSGMTIAVAVITVFVLLIMSIPALNLVNINISRIMERSSEIGVRKAFGASSRTLVYQFLTENLLLTFIGGAIGVLFSWICIQIINKARLIDNVELTLNFTVLLYSLLACLFFGVLSGVYPAWRMSRMNPVTALKG